MSNTASHTPIVANPTTAKATLGEMTSEFRRVFGLPDQGILFTRHDAVHAMTGLGVSMADELRVAIYERGFSNFSSKVPLVEMLVARRLSELHETLINAFNKKSALNVKPGGLQSAAFERAQLDTPELHPQEVLAHTLHAIKVGRAIYKLTGKKYAELLPAEVSKLDFSAVDIASKVYDIKSAALSRQAAAVEQKTAAILFENAKEISADAHDIPAAGTPWHGARRMVFAS